MANVEDIIEQLVRNENLSRLLCIALATEMQKAELTRDDLRKLSYELLIKAFPEIVRTMFRQRTAFVQELRQLWKHGPTEYLRRVARLLRP